jgi:long-chain acyl-CoA synthetase
MSGIGFGLTETNGAGSGDLGAAVRRQTAQLGVAVADRRGAHHRPRQARPLPAGQAGEIWMRGVTVMQGYWGQPEATAQAMHGGWFRTGDIGYLDEEGFLFVVDRLKDVINRSGEKIAAAEVESCLLTAPQVEEAAVFARPDDTHRRGGGRVVVPRPGADLHARQGSAHVAGKGWRPTRCRREV